MTANSFGTEGVSIWKAADLSPLFFIATAESSAPAGACSDGINFWVALSSVNQIIRF